MNKKRKNNKGFTLIELLAVVVILLAISVMAISSISAAIERNKAKQDETKKAVLISYGKLYYEEHKNSLKPNNGVVCIPISSLDLDESEQEDANGNPFIGYIKYTVNNKTYEYVESCS